MKMKMKIVALFLLVAFTAAAVLTGCGAGGLRDGSTSNICIILGGITLFSSGTTSNYISSEAASSSRIASISPANMQFPNGNTLNYRVASGSLTTNNYYYGTSSGNLGSLSDPFSETVQRQLYISTQYSAPLNGTYTATMSSMTKSIAFTQSSYMPVINTSDISTISGANRLNVGGDVITVANQTNPNYRYLCRIYDTQLSPGTVDRYWTSVDVRGVDWTNSDRLFNFFVYSIAAPANNRVQFPTPAGVFNQGGGNANLRVVITAYDTSVTSSNTAGDMDSFTWAVSEVRVDMIGQ